MLCWSPGRDFTTSHQLPLPSVPTVMTRQMKMFGMLSSSAASTMGLDNLSCKLCRQTGCCQCILHGLLIHTKNLGFHPLKKHCPTHYAKFGQTWGGQGWGILKSCPWFPKLWVWLMTGRGRCLRVILQTHEPINFCYCRWTPSRVSYLHRHRSKDPHQRQ